MNKLSLIDIEALLTSIPVGYKAADDEFFAAFDHVLIPAYKKLGVLTNDEEAPRNDTKLYCNVHGCQLVFDNVGTYQTHFNAVHRYVCQECNRHLPTPHLLDLHITERHDSYFAVKLERKDMAVAMYCCFLEECKDKFFTVQERKEHCITQHKFPTNYRYFDVKSASDGKESEKIKSEIEAMDEELDKEATAVNRKPKLYSFGHQREKTFNSKAERKMKSDSGKTLVTMHDLKEALDDI